MKKDNYLFCYFYNFNLQNFYCCSYSHFRRKIMALICNFFILFMLCLLLLIFLYNTQSLILSFSYDCTFLLAMTKKNERNQGSLDETILCSLIGCILLMKFIFILYHSKRQHFQSREFKINLNKKKKTLKSMSNVHIEWLKRSHKFMLVIKNERSRYRYAICIHNIGDFPRTISSRLDRNPPAAVLCASMSIEHDVVRYDRCVCDNTHIHNNSK